MPKLKIEFGNCVDDDGPDTCSSAWYDRIVFYDSCIWGVSLPTDSEDQQAVRLAEVKCDGGRYGYVNMVGQGLDGKPCTYARYDIFAQQ